MSIWPFSRRPAEKRRTRTRNIPYGIIIDTNTNIVVAVHRSPAVLVFLAECFPDTSYVPYANVPHYTDYFFLVDIPPRELVSWRRDKKSRRFEKVAPELVTEQMRADAVLAAKKGEIARRIMTHLSMNRHRARTGVEFQETVYLLKRIEAEKCKESGYDEARAVEFPFVLQYADFADIPLKEAADEIIFKAKLDEQLLAKTEFLRLKHFSALKKAQTAEEADAVIAALIKDLYRNTI